METGNVTAQPQLTSVTAPAAKDPPVRLFIGAAMMAGFGIWCLVDMGNYPYAPPTLETINKFAPWAVNHFAPVIFFPVCLVLATMGYIRMKRVMVADAEGIGYQGKAKMAWGSIKTMDASKFKSKGILRLIDQEGKVLVLDSWWLQNYRDLIAFVESHVPEQARQ